MGGMDMAQMMAQMGGGGMGGMGGMGGEFPPHPTLNPEP